MITLPQGAFLNCAPLVIWARSMPPVVSLLRASIATGFRSRVSMQRDIIARRPHVALDKQTGSRPRLRTSKRVLWMWLSRLWPGSQRAVAFVQPRTVIAWQQKRCREHWRRLRLSGAPGQPAHSKAVRKRLQALWRSHPTGGLPRIVGALRQVGLAVAKSPLVQDRPQVRTPPSPTWQAFLANHGQDLAALDCFTVSTVTGKVLFVLVSLAHERDRWDMSM